MTSSGGGRRYVDAAAAAAEGRGLVRRMRVLAAVTAVAAGALVVGIGFGGRALVHTADADGSPDVTVTTDGGTETTSGTTGTDEPLRTVPDVVGEPEGRAAEILGDAGFGVAVEPVDAEGVESGIVAEQDPPAGTEVPAGTTVTLGVAAGPELVTLPVVDGQPEAAARGTLEALGFEVLDVVAEESEDVAQGIVIRTDPAGGSQVPPGTGVTVVVSTGPPEPVVD